MQDELIIYEFSDPLCPWCWGSEPIIRKVETRFENVKVIYSMVGMYQDIRKNLNEEDDDSFFYFNQNMASKFEEQAKKNKMPVNPDAFDFFDKKLYSTWDMCIAFKSAQRQSNYLANKLMRRFREQIFLEGKKAGKKSMILQTMIEVGLDIDKYMEDMSNGTAKKAFDEDIEFAKSNQVISYPSYLFSYNGETVLVRGFTHYQTMVSLIKGLTEGKIKEKENFGEVIDVIKKYEGISIYELSQIFDKSPSDINKILKEYSDLKLIRFDEYGDNIYIRYNFQDSCLIEGCK